MDIPSPLWRVPSSGGTPVKVLDGVVRGAFAVLDRGIYYIDRSSREGALLDDPPPAGEAHLQYFDFTTRKSTSVARNVGNVSLGLSASRDGQTAFFSRVDSLVDDLMVVENLR